MARKIIIFSEYETESPNRKAQKCPQQSGHHFPSQKLIFLAIVGPQIFPDPFGEDLQTRYKQSN